MLSSMSHDAIDQMERDIDAHMRAAMPEAFAWMLEARRRHADAGEPGGVPPPPEPRTVEIDDKKSRQPTLKVVVSAPPGDAEVEALLGSLLLQSYAAASKSYRLAENFTTEGLPVEMRDVHLHQAARLTRACAELTVALA